MGLVLARSGSYVHIGLGPASLSLPFAATVAVAGAGPLEVDLFLSSVPLPPRSLCSFPSP